jgi:RNA polymerase sigma-70 factor (ECF subfamily)
MSRPRYFLCSIWVILIPSGAYNSELLADGPRPQASEREEARYVLLNIRAPRIAFVPSSLGSEGLSETCVPELGPGERKSAFFPFRVMRRRLRADEKLVADLQAGDPDALTELFKRHSGLLYGLAKRIVRNDAEAEDVVQQTFLDVFRAIQQFDPHKGPFKTWLLMFAYHRAFNHLRSLNAHRFYLTCTLDEVLQRPMLSRSIAEVRVLMDQALSLLPARERQTIELVYYSGFTSMEVAMRTNQTVRVVRHNLYRGLEKLRKILSANEPRGRAKLKGDSR